MNTAVEAVKEPGSSPMESGRQGNEFAYRSVSKAAIASMVFALFGTATAFMAQLFVVIPAIGLAFGVLAIANFRRFPEELTGKMSAKIGLFLSLIVFITSVGYHSYIYATEVPEGYQRISFSDLRPNPKTPELPFSEKSMEFDGKKVFVKGYVRPGAKKRKLKEFILVGDFGTCCFGGNPKITDVVAVSIIGDDTVDYGYSLRRIAGTFHLNQQTRATKEKDIPQVFYEIHTDEVR
ncbi:MAG: DUF3299 domain-containing protein [Mariniblastus sp.]|nr:DUF3299 domain-containing protein [Mariniblastus sp.]